MDIVSEENLVLGLDVSTKTIGISLFEDKDEAGILKLLHHVTPKVKPEPESIFALATQLKKDFSTLLSVIKAAELIDLVVQALFAPAFHLELLALRQAPQLIDQYPPVNQEGAAGLVAVEVMQQCDRPSATQSEQTLDDGPVHHGHVQRLQHSDHFRNLQ